MLSVLALVLLPGVATAQSQAAAESEPLAMLPGNSVDFGIRGTHLTGDSARFERYRDMGNGLFLETLRYNRQLNGWLLTATGDHVGRTDQRLTGTLVKPGKLKLSGMWDQIPMVLSRATATLFIQESPAVLTVPDTIQTIVQAQPAQITNMVSQFSRPFDLETRRYIAEGRVEYLASPAVTVHTNVRNIDRKGEIPFGGSFGHSSFAETMGPIRHNTTDIDGGAEYVQGNALVRGGYNLSWFRNDTDTLTFDNPYNAMDRLTPTPVLTQAGRFALVPSNNFFTINGMGSYRLPGRTRATAYVATGWLSDTGIAILPFTINTAMPTYPLERGNVDGEARTNDVNLHLTSRPVRGLNVNLRYKYYNYGNNTPHFEGTGRVAYDAANQPTTAYASEPFSVNRNTFDADVMYSPVTAMSAGGGYSRIGEERSHRIYASTADNVYRLLFDWVGHQRFTVRTKYEHAERRGSGFDADAIPTTEQPNLRHYDLAERDRDRITVLGTVFAASNLSFNLSVGAGRDDYLNTTFGLLDNKHRVYTIGTDATPSERTTFGLSYSYEDYRSLSQSRQWSSDVEKFDVRRNWSTDGHDRAHSFMADAEVKQIREKVDLRFAYDYSRARATTFYETGPVERTLPEGPEDIVSTLPPPTQLPPAYSATHRGTVDLTYALSGQLGIGFSYWYEQYRVEDWTLDAQANPSLDRGSALLLGYIYEPYTANTFWGRILYRW
jgi:MtrB/PioB family decaheme-associated outer membrane protein